MSKKGRSRPEHQLYAYALPLVPTPSTSLFARSINGILPSYLAITTVENPRCVATFDAMTRSVWVTNKKDREILWRRGFFGKGNLSRSEPSWLNRRMNQLRSEASVAAGGKKILTSEEVTAQRRAERKHFKAERERAVAEAAAHAEAVFQAEGKLVEAPAEHISTTSATATSEPQNDSASATPPSQSVEGDAEDTEVIVPDIEEVDDVEHLQLSLQEAFFLSWALDCLAILDPATGQYLSPEDLFLAFLRSSCSLPTAILSSLSASATEHLWRRFDNPFLINYVAYHHFRSLGWVVKSGIKFCVDLLLYKKGPVFSHAEFSIVVCPVYEDPSDEETSPFDLPNTKPFSWAWLSTLNRANTQVRKALMIAYVTIPSWKRVPLDKLHSPEVITQYSVREVTVKRFVPARMRD
ncbi:hypothetical protein DL93DRAFT_2214408 [Clavulina sp. PMI_390]|nr:hypothetical protein DL93DRAFT_2214408 [Clavulina sp. PMI_390]